MQLTDIDTIAVLGAGTMGHGIAEVAALAGYTVHLRDISEELVEQGYDELQWSIEKLAESGEIDDSEAEGAIERVETFVDIETAVDDVEFVIEVVPEEMDIKKEVFEEVDEYAPEDTVFATNTSTLSITELSETTDRQSQFCGMHFFNPPVRMPLVEVITGAHTSDETLSVAEDLADSMGKTPVRVRKDVPGFIVNRVLVPMLNEAAWQVELGNATVAEVDSTTKYGIELPMGCFELSDQIGIDVLVDVLDYMHETMGEAYEPCPFLVERAESGHHGKKSGEGFYQYDDGRPEIPDDEIRSDVERRLLGVAANEAAKLVAADVAEPAEIDKAVTLGAGFPDGPTQLASDAGFDSLFEELETQYEQTGASRYEPAELLGAWAESGTATSPDRSNPAYETLLYESPAEGVAHVILNRPEQLNSLNETVLDELDSLLQDLEADEETRVILLSGAGDRAFSGGAEIGQMSGGMESLDAIEFSRKGQETFGALKRSSMPVVAAVDGFCLGGGMELAMCADILVASDSARFGLPEVTLGILPGWGGTQRLSRIVGERRAREILLTGEQFDVETMYEYGFVNRIHDDDELMDEALDLAARLADGAPLAQGMIKRVMEAGTEDIEAGLTAESDGLGLLFTTDDTIEGLDAFENDREPEFTGR